MDAGERCSFWKTQGKLREVKRELIDWRILVNSVYGNSLSSPTPISCLSAPSLLVSGSFISLFMSSLVPLFFFSVSVVFCFLRLIPPSSTLFYLEILPGWSLYYDAKCHHHLRASLAPAHAQAVDIEG